MRLYRNKYSETSKLNLQFRAGNVTDQSSWSTAEIKVGFAWDKHRNCKASYWNEQKTSKKGMRTKQKGQKKKAKQQLFCKYSCPVENLLNVHSGLEFWSNGITEFGNKEANKRLLKLQPAIDGWLQREKSAVNLYKNMSSTNQQKCSKFKLRQQGRVWPKARMRMAWWVRVIQRSNMWLAF